MQCPGDVTKRQRYLDTVNLQHVKILFGTTFEGIVLVASIAFEKRVGAKFMFDNWYTTSEVACDYAGKACTSKRNGEKDWDLFRFKIELNNDNIKTFEKTNCGCACIMELKRRNTWTTIMVQTTKNVLVDVGFGNYKSLGYLRAHLGSQPTSGDPGCATPFYRAPANRKGLESRRREAPRPSSFTDTSFNTTYSQNWILYRKGALVLGWSLVTW